MATIVILYPDRAPEVIESAHTPDYVGRDDVLINPDLSAVQGVQREHWKVVGKKIVEMTQEEKNALPAKDDVDSHAQIAAKVDAALSPLGITLDEVRIAIQY